MGFAQSSFNYSTATVPQVIAAYEDAAVQQVPETAEFVAMAKKWKLHTASYEGGPGYKVGGEKPGTKGAPQEPELRAFSEHVSTVVLCIVSSMSSLAGLDTMIAASRDAGMKAAIIKQVRMP